MEKTQTLLAMLLSNTATIMALCVEAVDDKGDHYGYHYDQHYDPIHADDLDCKDRSCSDVVDCQDCCRTDNTDHCRCR